MATIKQELAVQEMVENGGNVSGAMRAVGYSVATAKNPSKLTESDGFKELMQKYLPDELLAKKHLELLNKQEVIVRNNVTTGLIETVPTGEMDVTARTKALDMAYKLKGLYKDGQQPGNQTINFNFINSPEVQKKVQEFEADLKAQLISKPLTT